MQPTRNALKHKVTNMSKAKKKKKERTLIKHWSGYMNIIQSGFQSKEY